MDRAYACTSTSLVHERNIKPIGSASGKMLRMTHDRSGRHVTRPRGALFARSYYGNPQQSTVCAVVPDTSLSQRNGASHESASEELTDE